MSLLDWRHTDSRELSPAIAAGLQRAQAWDWRADDASAADLRALLLGTALVGTGLLHQEPGATPDGVPVLDASPLDASAPADSSDSAKAAWQLGKNLVTLSEYAMRVGGVSGSFGFQFETHDGAAAVDVADPWQPRGGDDAGNPVLIIAGAVAIVAVAAITAGAICFIAHEALPVVERVLESDEETKRLAADHSTALLVLQNHAQREKDAGKLLALDEGERDVLHAVEDSRQQVEKRLAALTKQREPKGFFESLFSQPLVVVGAFATGALVVTAANARRRST